MADATTEGDEPRGPAEDNSTGRLLALSDGVFAIAMTLLALDLRLPDLGEGITDGQLRHALGDEWRSYLAFVISFYIVASYWSAHRRAMHAVVEVDRRVIGRTLFVLLLVAALPFPSSVLAEYGGEPFALVLYGAFNVVAGVALLRLVQVIPGQDGEERTRIVAGMVVFTLCIPGAYVLGGQGPLLLLLLIVSGRVPSRLRRAASRDVPP